MVFVVAGGVAAPDADFFASDEYASVPEIHRRAYLETLMDLVDYWENKIDIDETARYLALFLKEMDGAGLDEASEGQILSALLRIDPNLRVSDAQLWAIRTLYGRASGRELPALQALGLGNATGGAYRKVMTAESTTKNREPESRQSAPKAVTAPQSTQSDRHRAFRDSLNTMLGNMDNAADRHDLGSRRRDLDAEKAGFDIMKSVNYPYHNLEHAKDVTETAVKLARLENLSDNEIKLIGIAGAFHDTGFTVKYKDNEPDGARLAGDYMKKHNYPESDIKTVQDLIIKGTTVPQQPETKMQKVLADADVANFGRKDFFELGDRVRQEIGVKDTLAWHEGSLKLLEQHRFFTESANTLYGEQQKKNEDELRSMISKENREHIWTDVYNKTKRAIVASGIVISLLATSNIGIKTNIAQQGLETQPAQTRMAVVDKTGAGTPNYDITNEGYLVSNWAGYGVASNFNEPEPVVTKIGGSWKVQKVLESSKDAVSAQWIGIGGLFPSDSTLIQAGTGSFMVGGRPGYSAWYELLPGPSKKIPIDIYPGDVINAEIKQVDPAQSKWRIEIDDLTQNEIVVIITNYKSSKLSGEWIEELPENGISTEAVLSGKKYKLEGVLPLPLANFGVAEFGHKFTGGMRNSATINGQDIPISSANHIKISMVFDETKTRQEIQNVINELHPPKDIGYIPESVNSGTNRLELQTKTDNVTPNGSSFKVEYLKHNEDALISGYDTFNKVVQWFGR